MATTSCRREWAIKNHSTTSWLVYIIIILILIVPVSETSIHAANNETYLLTGGVAAVGGWSADQQTIVAGSTIGSPQQYSTDSAKIISGGIVGLAFGQGSMLPIRHSQPFIDTTTVTSRTIALSIESGNGQTSGRLFCRRGGGFSFTELAMTSSSGGDSLFGDIPSSVFSIRGVEYYVDIERDNLHASIGSRSSPRKLVTRVTNEDGQRISRLPDQKYRIISVPVDIEYDSSVEAVFENDFGSYDESYWRLSRYNGMTGSYSEFPNVSPVSPGQGYWLITRDLNRSYGTAGLSVQPTRTIGGTQYYELPLDSGWNQLGNPFAFDIDWADVLYSVSGQIIGYDPGVVEDSIYWYDGTSYRTILTIPAWDGFFLNVKRDEITALFPYCESQSAKTASSPGQETDSGGKEWTLQLSLTSGDLVDGNNYVGVRLGASRGNDEYDYAEPPRAPGAPMLALAGSGWLDSLVTAGPRPSPLRCDYRPSGLPGYSWSLQMSPGTDSRLSVEGVTKLPSGIQLALIFDGEQTISLTADTSVIVPVHVTTATLSVGRAVRIESGQRPLPREFSLYQNHPNPFNPSSTITFALPESRYVMLDIINILGQKVLRLIDARLVAGQHSVTWDGRNSSGHQVSSGVYFYRFKAGSFVETKKMVLLR